MNLLVTNFEHSGEDVMVMTPDYESLSVPSLAAALLFSNQHFDDIVEVSDQERPCYVYDPLWADDEFLKNVRFKAGRCPIPKLHRKLREIGYVSRNINS